MKLGNSKSFFAQQLFVALCKGFYIVLQTVGECSFEQSGVRWNGVSHFACGERLFGKDLGRGQGQAEPQCQQTGFDKRRFHDGFREQVKDGVSPSVETPSYQF